MLDLVFKYSASFYKYEMVLEFLITTKNGGTRWKIAQKAMNLDYHNSDRILSQLVDSENLIYHSNTKRYTVSDKGRHLLEVIKKFNSKYNKIIT